MAYVYIVECRDKTLYTGWTTDVERRVSQHNKGKGAKYTRARRPVVLKYCEKFDTNREAMKREGEIKKLSRQDKIKLFDYN
ncbi:GIY-YIG nuclease family protein [Clostridium botulinum]|nr:GIY-YIG nuclease family protein [Clostridium botulinum]